MFRPIPRADPAKPKTSSIEKAKPKPKTEKKKLVFT